MSIKWITYSPASTSFKFHESNPQRRIMCENINEWKFLIWNIFFFLFFVLLAAVFGWATTNSAAWWFTFLFAFYVSVIPLIPSCSFLPPHQTLWTTTTTKERRRPLPARISSEHSRENPWAEPDGTRDASQTRSIWKSNLQSLWRAKRRWKVLMKVFFFIPSPSFAFWSCWWTFSYTRPFTFPVIEDFCFVSCVYVYNKAINQGLSYVELHLKVGGRKNYLLTSA